MRWTAARLVALEAMADGHQARNLLAMTSDGDFFALLDPVEQLAEFVLRLEGAYLAHDDSLFKLVHRIINN
jgi:hypothetical protein